MEINRKNLSRGYYVQLAIDILNIILHWWERRFFSLFLIFGYCGHNLQDDKNENLQNKFLWILNSLVNQNKMSKTAPPVYIPIFPTKPNGFTGFCDFEQIRHEMPKGLNTLSRGYRESSTRYSLFCS